MSQAESAVEAPESKGDSMHIGFTEEELEFQQEVRQFFVDKFPEDIRRKQDSGGTLQREDYIRWQKILFKQVATGYLTTLL